MGIVVEVISQLEIYSITKEALEVINRPYKINLLVKSKSIKRFILFSRVIDQNRLKTDQGWG